MAAFESSSLNGEGATVVTVGPAEALASSVESLGVSEVAQEGVSPVLRQQHVVSCGETSAVSNAAPLPMVSMTCAVEFVERHE